MKNTLQLRVITPERQVLDEAVVRVTLREVDGFVTLLPGHAALVAELGPGDMTFEMADGKVHHLAVCGGFLQVQDDVVKVLADSALWPSEINLERAREAERRARERVYGADHKIDYHRAASALHRAEARLEVAANHLLD